MMFLSDKVDLTDQEIEMILILAISLEESREIDRAIALYKVCIKYSNTIAMTRLADVFSEPPDYMNIKLAEELYLTACIAGNAAGCRNLAILYGQLGKSDLQQKYMNFAKARGDIWQDEE